MTPISRLAVLLCAAWFAVSCDTAAESSAPADAASTSDTVTASDTDTAPDTATASDTDTASGTDTVPDTDTASEDLPSPAALAAQVSREAYVDDLLFIASERDPGSDHWQAVQDLCAERFAALGYTVERHDFGGGVNVIGVLTGTDTPSEQVLVSAHYDHVPGCAGADDNATGVAGLFEVARVLAGEPHPRTLVVACWDLEELGLMGSAAYATRAAQREDDIVVAFVFEMIGYRDTAADSQEIPAGLNILFPEGYAEVEETGFRGDFLAVICNETATSSALLVESYTEDTSVPAITLVVPAGLETSPATTALQRSDHAAFWAHGYPAMMITDTANFRNPYYHCAAGPDSVDELDHDFAVAIVRGTTAAVAATLR